MIRVRDLSIGFGRSALLEHLDFEVRRGEAFLILGESGCGKSTLMRTMIGLLRPISGEIEFEDMDAATAGRPGKPAFGVLFQSSALLGSMSLARNVALPLREWTRLDERTIATIVSRKLALVGLSGFENYLPAQLSGGMKKRAGIARALALDPPLLFMDELSAGLDPVTAAGLDDLVQTLKRSLGVTFVIVTHELASIHVIGDRCILLDRGRRGIVATGSPGELEKSADPAARRFFHRLSSGEVGA